MLRSFATLTLFAAITCATIARAQESPPSARIIELTLAPANAPTPALKHQLLPPLPELQPRDAELIYARMFAAGVGHSPTHEADMELLDKYLNVPLGEFSVKDARALLERNPFRPDWLAEAARSRDCSWSLPYGQRPFFAILLPELAPLRDQGRFLALQTRIQIAEGDVEGALESIRTGYALARHAATGPTLIHALVGVAIASVFGDRVAELGAVPNAPSLYWALSQLPRPFIDTRAALATEMYSMELSYPDWSSPRAAGHSETYWEDFLSQLHQDLQLIGSQGLDLPTIRKNSIDAAKQHLLDTGMSAEEAETISDAQAIVILTIDNFNRDRDNVFKWAYLPYDPGQAGLVESIEQVGEKPGNDQGLPLAQIILPSLVHFRNAMERQERQIALLRTIEALRMHAADHGGQLPKSLDEVTCVPVPQDPWLGKPFTYSLDDEVAVLRANAPTGQPIELTTEYRLNIRKP